MLEVEVEGPAEGPGGLHVGQTKCSEDIITLEDKEMGLECFYSIFGWRSRSRLGRDTGNQPSTSRWSQRQRRASCLVGKGPLMCSLWCCIMGDLGSNALIT